MPESRKVLFGSLMPKKASMVADSMNELRRLLLRPPLQVTLDSQPLAAREIERFRHLTTNQIGDIYVFASTLFEDYYPFRIVLICDYDHCLASAARSKNPLACWGATIGQCLALVYGRVDKCVIWHEAFHLLGAKDCYEAEAPDRGICELDNCIMRYEPGGCESWDHLSLCIRNVALVKGTGS